jgi:hypothetical protein
LDRRLDELQSLSGRCGIEKNSQPLPALEPPIIQPYTTELFPFSCIEVEREKLTARRKLRNEELPNLYFSQNIVTVIKIKENAMGSL